MKNVNKESNKKGQRIFPLFTSTVTKSQKKAKTRGCCNFSKERTSRARKKTTKKDGEKLGQVVPLHGRTFYHFCLCLELKIH